MKTNTTKAKLAAGGTVHGAFFRTPDTSLIELQGFLGWDFLVLDGEHGTLQARDIEDQARACELRGLTAIARVTTNDAPTILRFMDTGAQGAHIPFINTVDDAERAVQAIKYHPRGQRGLAGIRAAEFGRGAPLSDYVRAANAETLVVAQIETGQAIGQLSEIAKVDGVDVVFIGPNDLAHSLGHAGHIGHPEVQDAMRRIADIVLACGKVLGLMVYDSAGARLWRERGARYITVPFESVLCPAVKQYLEVARS